MHKSFTSTYLYFNTALGTMRGTVIEVYIGHGGNINMGVVSSHKGREAG